MNQEGNYGRIPWSYTRRLFNVYSKQIITSRKFSRGNTLTINPRGSDINYGQNKRSVLDTNFKATCEKNN